MAQLDCIASVPDKRGDITAKEHLAIAGAHDQRRITPGSDDLPGRIAVQRNQAERALECVTHRTKGFGKIATCGKRFFEQMRSHFGVGLRSEHMASGGEARSQRDMVFDDAVVNDREIAVAIEVRVCVLISRCAMGGPPGMTQRGVTVRQRVSG